MTLGVPSVDFGLVKLGERAQTSLLLTNITQLEASWTLKERQDHKDTQVLSRKLLEIWLMFVQFYIMRNLCCLDLSGAMQWCFAALSLLQCGCGIYASFQSAISNRAAVDSGGWNRMVRQHKTLLFLSLSIVFKFSKNFGASIKMFLSHSGLQHSNK